MSDMSGSEFQCVREFLGLPAVWVADQLGVDRRTIYRWESEEFTLPDAASERMRQWRALTDQTVGRVTVEVMSVPGSFLEAMQDGENGDGFPPSWQRMVCARVAERTGREIVWMEVDA